MKARRCWPGNGVGTCSGPGWPREVVDAGAALLDAPGIGVLHDAGLACNNVRVHSLHDVTEGGIITALREVAAASGLVLGLEEDSVPVLPQTAVVCEALGLNPLGLLASGALLITLPPEDVPRLLSTLDGAGIDGWEIGQMLSPQEGTGAVRPARGRSRASGVQPGRDSQVPFYFNVT